LNSDTEDNINEFKECACRNCFVKPNIRLKMPLIRKTGWFCEKHSKEMMALELAEKLNENEGENE
jgi:hypothetical protein